MKSGIEIGDLRSKCGIIVTAEEAYQITTSYYSAGRIYYRTTYHNNEIFITSISPAGQIDWVRMIPKKQEFSDTDYFNGYMLMEQHDNLYFLYNDDEDNINQPLTKRAKQISSFRDAVAALVTVIAPEKWNAAKYLTPKKTLMP